MSVCPFEIVYVCSSSQNSFLLRVTCSQDCFNKILNVTFPFYSYENKGELRFKICQHFFAHRGYIRLAVFDITVIITAELTVLDTDNGVIWQRWNSGEGQRVMQKLRVRNSTLEYLNRPCIPTSLNTLVIYITSNFSLLPISLFNGFPSPAQASPTPTTAPRHPATFTQRYVFFRYRRQSPYHGSNLVWVIVIIQQGCDHHHRSENKNRKIGILSPFPEKRKRSTGEGLRAIAMKVSFFCSYTHVDIFWYKRRVLRLGNKSIIHTSVYFYDFPLQPYQALWW